MRTDLDMPLNNCEHVDLYGRHCLNHAPPVSKCRTEKNPHFATRSSDRDTAFHLPLRSDEITTIWHINDAMTLVLHLRLRRIQQTSAEIKP